MIYTCTTNPSLDYFIRVPNLNLGDDLRSTHEAIFAGGKGVNVSIVLNNMEIPSVCLGFLGGFTKDYFLSFLTRYKCIQPLFTSIEDHTRINVKIIHDDNETDINAKGPHISDEEFEKFKVRLNKIYTDDYFVLSGNVEDEIKDKMIDVLHDLSKDGVKIILDCEQDINEACLDTKIFAIKLNNNNAPEDIEEYAYKLLDSGVENVIYSAPNSVNYIFTKDSKISCDSFKNDLVNVTGTADSLH